jgi:undecaprenyl-diphosphatase
MKKRTQKDLILAICILTAFALWTVAIQCIDVQAIGPRETSVGFATFNLFVHNQIGVHIALYNITDWLSLVPVAFIIGFALLGLIQWIKRKHLARVDHDILMLGGFYIAVILAYILFEIFVVNYRPILLNGQLEASYPSSTTMLVMCVMPTSTMQFNTRIKNNLLKRFAVSAVTAFVIFMLLGRIISGVHWITDIIGGALLSAGLVLMYRVMISKKVDCRQ